MYLRIYGYMYYKTLYYFREYANTYLHIKFIMWPLENYGQNKYFYLHARIPIALFFAGCVISNTVWNDMNMAR